MRSKGRLNERKDEIHDMCVYMYIYLYIYTIYGCFFSAVLDNRALFTVYSAVEQQHCTILF